MEIIEERLLELTQLRHHPINGILQKEVIRLTHARDAPWEHPSKLTLLPPAVRLIAGEDVRGIDQVFMFTAAAVSPGVSAGELLASLVTLTAVYAVLLVVEVKLLVKYIRGGVVSAMPELVHAPADENEDATPGSGGPGGGKPGDDVLAFAY